MLYLFTTRRCMLSMLVPPDLMDQSMASEKSSPMPPAVTQAGSRYDRTSGAAPSFKHSSSCIRRTVTIAKVGRKLRYRINSLTRVDYSLMPVQTLALTARGCSSKPAANVADEAGRSGQSGVTQCAKDYTASNLLPARHQALSLWGCHR